MGSGAAQRLADAVRAQELDDLAADGQQLLEAALDLGLPIGARADRRASRSAARRGFHRHESASARERFRPG